MSCKITQHFGNQTNTTLDAEEVKVKAGRLFKMQQTNSEVEIMDEDSFLGIQ